MIYCDFIAKTYDCTTLHYNRRKIDGLGFNLHPNCLFRFSLISSSFLGFFLSLFVVFINKTLSPRIPRENCIVPLSSINSNSFISWELLVWAWPYDSLTEILNQPITTQVNSDRFCDWLNYFSRVKISVEHSPYLFALGFWLSLVWNIEFDGLGFFS